MARFAPALKRLIDLPEDARRLGPFVLVRQLGRGGFAPVWLAKETYGGTELRLAAVKLFALGASESSYKERIIEEARILCRVEHPNVVRFYSLASEEASGVMGVAMEYLTGKSLDDQIAESGKRPTAETLRIGASIASALSAVHRAGLLHRDVKPPNVIDSAGVYKLIDFGIAAPGDGGTPGQSPHPGPVKPVLVDELPLEVTHAARRRIAGAVTILPAGSPNDSPNSFAPRGGTPGYVDPACIVGKAPETPASDLYALGVLLFECATGKHPAAMVAGAGGGLSVEVLEGRTPPPSLCAVAPEEPIALGELVDALLAADPQKRPKSAEWVAIELERIRGQAAGLRRALPPESVGPFRGLGRFEEDDRDVYFGRSSEVASALELLRTHGTVAIVGPSGSGKSSLARAGVLPRIVDGALGPWPKTWDAVITVPGSDPRGAILAGLAQVGELPPFGPDVRAADVAVALAERAQVTSRGLVLLVDQLEELVTASSPVSRQWAVELLARIGATPRTGVRAIVAARRDLLDPLLALEGLGNTLVRGSLLVEPISDATWGDVLVHALGAYGYALEDDALHAELLAQLKGTAGAMPLVQFALTELWYKRDPATKLVTRAGLREIGGIAGSLERHADATVAELTRQRPEALAMARQALLALTTPQGTRATKTPEEIAPAWHEVLDALERARLVVRAPEGVTLAHEALLTQWGRLRGWVAEAREDRLLAEEIERDARRWHADPEVVPVWKKRRLAMAEDALRRGEAPLSAGAIAFVGAGRRAERRARVVLAGAVSVALALGGSVAVGYVRAVQANERTAIEKAAIEAQKASVEQQKRVALEDAQSEIDKRQKEIDALVQRLSSAGDGSTVRDVQRQIQEAQQGARAARDRIASIAPQSKPRPETSTTAAAPPTPEPPPAPTPTMKVQRE